MPSSDIYKVKETSQGKATSAPVASSRLRHRPASFDETVQKDLSRTNRRRHRNSGFRRFRHLMKKPDFSKKFWMIVLSAGFLILVLVVIWDWFFRYSAEAPEPVAPANEVQAQ